MKRRLVKAALSAIVCALTISAFVTCLVSVVNKEPTFWAIFEVISGLFGCEGIILGAIYWSCL